MHIEQLYFRPDEQTGPDICLEHLRDLKKENPEGFKDFVGVRQVILKFFEDIPEISDLGSIPKYLAKARQNPQEWKEMNQAACVYLCGLQGVDLDSETANSIVHQAMKTAEIALDYFANSDGGLLPNQEGNLSQMSGPREESEPLGLIEMMLNPDRYARRIRFEAARKLELAFEALQLFLQEDNSEQQQKWLVNFFNDYIWNSGKIGQLTPIECVAHYETDDFSCREVTILRSGDSVRLSEFDEYHELQMRRTHWGTLAMMDHRVKPPDRRLIKWLRRKRENDGYNLEEMRDVLGLRLTFLSKEDIYKFIAEFRQKVADLGAELTEVEEVEDNLGGSNQNRPQAVKTTYRLVKTGEIDITFEMQLMTLKGYFDYMMKDGMAHEEYELRRVLAVTAALFPQAIYQTDIQHLFEIAVEGVREAKLNGRKFLPAERFPEKTEYQFYGERRARRAIETIKTEMEKRGFFPEIIVAEFGAAKHAEMLNQRLGNKCVVVLVDPKNNEQLTQIGQLVDNKSVLIFLNVSHTGQTAQTMRNIFGDNALVAAMIHQGGEVAFAGENDKKNTWYEF